MKVKDLEKYRNKKLVRIEHEYNDIYNVDVTDNGYQFHGCYRGSLKNVKIIAKAFEKIGYKIKDTSSDSGER